MPRRDPPHRTDSPLPLARAAAACRRRTRPASGAESHRTARHAAARAPPAAPHDPPGPPARTHRTAPRSRAAAVARACAVVGRRSHLNHPACQTPGSALRTKGRQDSHLVAKATRVQRRPTGREIRRIRRGRRNEAAEQDAAAGIHPTARRRPASAVAADQSAASETRPTAQPNRAQVVASDQAAAVGTRPTVRANQVRVVAAARAAAAGILPTVRPSPESAAVAGRGAAVGTRPLAHPRARRMDAVGRRRPAPDPGRRADHRRLLPDAGRGADRERLLLGVRVVHAAVPLALMSGEGFAPESDRRTATCIGWSRCRRRTQVGPRRRASGTPAGRLRLRAAGAGAGTRRTGRPSRVPGAGAGPGVAGTAARRGQPRRGGSAAGTPRTDRAAVRAEVHPIGLAAARGPVGWPAVRRDGTYRRGVTRRRGGRARAVGALRKHRRRRDRAGSARDDRHRADGLAHRADRAWADEHRAPPADVAARTAAHPAATRRRRVPRPSSRAPTARRARGAAPVRRDHRRGRADERNHRRPSCLLYPA